MRPYHARHQRRGTSRGRGVRALCSLAAALVAGTSATLVSAGPAGAVVGGTSAYQGEYPFMVSLRENGYPYCGGTLVASSWVLTAAHCISGRTAGELAAVVDQAARDGSAGQTLSVDRTVVDSRYDPDTEDFDVALVHLASPAVGVAPLAIDPAGVGDTAYAASGKVATVIGYGSVDPEDLNGNGAVDYPATLQQAPVTIDADSSCSAVFNGADEPAALTSVMLCAGGDGVHDACVGDSGGPLLMPNGSAGWTQVGIVSWGSGCAVRGVPGVYTRLSDEQINGFVKSTIGS
jgi:secreted trypsin-like serine protease